MSETPMEKAMNKEVEWFEFEAEGFEKPLRARIVAEDKVGLMMARLGKRKSNPQDYADFINWVVAMFDDDSQEAITERMLDFDDEFGMEELMGLWSEIMEHISARPTKQPSDFTPSQKPGGKKSTARASVRASTSQRSRQTGS